ncbi:DoxX family membrane protein [bacterium]|nr:MAG: DoxX family membrane protein [bacterium]
MKFPFITTNHAIAILRITVGIIFVAHGAIRTYAGTVGGFGEFLIAKGFPLGVAVAWGITVFELLGGSLLALGKYTRIIGVIFIFHQIMGIVLVHFQNGWFVVGHSTGGMEYSALLIASLIAIIAREPN